MKKLRIGIDLGGTKIAAGLVDEECRLLEKETAPTGAGRSQEAIFDTIARTARRLLERTGMEASFVGVGSPGMIDSQAGTVTYASNLDWTRVPLAQAVSDRLGVPCRISNDANCAALGEVAAGAAKGTENAIMITLGTGVGSGIILGGKIFAGSASAGAELGHTLLVYDGETCTCGRKGCLERYASGAALQRQARRMALERPDSLLGRLPQEKITGATPFELMDRDEASRQVVETYLGYVGGVLTDLVNLFRPQALVIGGGVSHQGERLLQPLREYVAAHAYGGSLAPLPRIAAAALGNDAGIIGAACL